MRRGGSRPHLLHAVSRRSDRTRRGAICALLLLLRSAIARGLCGVRLLLRRIILLPREPLLLRLRTVCPRLSTVRTGRLLAEAATRWLTVRLLAARGWIRARLTGWPRLSTVGLARRLPVSALLLPISTLLACLRAIRRTSTHTVPRLSRGVSSRPWCSVRTCCSARIIITRLARLAWSGIRGSK